METAIRQTYTERNELKIVRNSPLRPVQTTETVESKDDFNLGATIAVISMLIAFLGSTFYVLISSYLDIS